MECGSIISIPTYRDDDGGACLLGSAHELNDRVLGLLMRCRAGRQLGGLRRIADGLLFFPVRTHEENSGDQEVIPESPGSQIPLLKGKDFLSVG